MKENKSSISKLLHLERELNSVKKKILKEMDGLYPEGKQVRFLRNHNQRNLSSGVIVCNWCMSSPEVRVRYNNSDHVVGLYPGLNEIYVEEKP